ncbi:uncharacterized protein LOC133326945 [Musca vetustissima]|uniref:uncharacterized protein LOC133326945 n=1 Tax=Musca vetustissima TaxID=27455 RepID=UPI002AB77601|nr:uncharacterized protein LOC133326945 [Musca vetustissima]
MSDDNFEKIVAPLIIKKQDTCLREAISVHERLALTLRFLATGRHFNDLSYTSVMGRNTVCEIVMETCQALNMVLKDFIKKSCNEFRKKWNFFHCMGAIDGKHVAIRKPANSGYITTTTKFFTTTKISLVLC